MVSSTIISELCHHERLFCGGLDNGKLLEFFVNNALALFSSLCCEQEYLMNRNRVIIKLLPSRIEKHLDTLSRRFELSDHTEQSKNDYKIIVRDNSVSYTLSIKLTVPRFQQLQFYNRKEQPGQEHNITKLITT